MASFLGSRCTTFLFASHEEAVAVADALEKWHGMPLAVIDRLLAVGEDGEWIVSRVREIGFALKSGRVEFQ